MNFEKAPKIFGKADLTHCVSEGRDLNDSTKKCKVDLGDNIDFRIPYDMYYELCNKEHPEVDIIQRIPDTILNRNFLYLRLKKRVIL